MHQRHVAKGRGKRAARERQVAAPTFEVGELVEFQFNGRWKDGVVTSISPLLVRYHNLPDDEGSHHDNVRKKIIRNLTEEEEEELKEREEELERLEEAAEDLWLQQQKGHHSQVQQLQERFRNAQESMKKSHEESRALLWDERSYREERGPYWSQRVKELHHAEKQLERMGDLREAKQVRKRVGKIEAEERYQFMWSLLKEFKVKEEKLLAAQEREREALHQRFKKQLGRLLLAQEEQQLNLAHKVEDLTLSASRPRLEKQLRDLGAKPEEELAPWARCQYVEPLAPQTRALQSTCSRPVRTNSAHAGKDGTQSPFRAARRSPTKTRPTWSPVWTPSANNQDVSIGSNVSSPRRQPKGKVFEGIWTSPGPLPGWNSEQHRRRGPMPWPGASSNAFWDSLEKSAVNDTSSWDTNAPRGQEQLGGESNPEEILDESEGCSMAVEVETSAVSENDTLWVPEWQRRREREAPDAYFILRGEPVPQERIKASGFHQHWSTGLRNDTVQEHHADARHAQARVRSATPTGRS